MKTITSPNSTVLQLHFTFSLSLAQKSEIHNLVKFWSFFLLKIITFEALSNIKLNVRSHSLCMQL